MNEEIYYQLINVNSSPQQLNRHKSHKYAQPTRLNFSAPLSFAPEYPKSLSNLPSNIPLPSPISTDNGFNQPQMCSVLQVGVMKANSSPQIMKNSYEFSQKIHKVNLLPLSLHSTPQNKKKLNSFLKFNIKERIRKNLVNKL